LNKNLRCDKCREPIVPAFFGKNKTKVWTKYTLDPINYMSMEVCKACYYEANPQKEEFDHALPSG
tara:strand:+ start:661 stop:855 length:195 start_codon:yes stop_codon:yes gene_type:complete